MTLWGLETLFKLWNIWYQTHLRCPTCPCYWQAIGYILWFFGEKEWCSETLSVNCVYFIHITSYDFILECIEWGTLYHPALHLLSRTILQHYETMIKNCLLCQPIFPHRPPGILIREISFISLTASKKWDKATKVSPPFPCPPKVGWCPDAGRL